MSDRSGAGDDGSGSEGLGLTNLKLPILPDGPFYLISPEKTGTEEEKPTRKRKRIGRFLYGVWKTVKGFFCCCCHSCAVDVVEPFVHSDLEPEPDPDTSSPDPDPSSPDPDPSSPDPDTSSPDPDTSSPAPDLSDIEPNNGKNTLAVLGGGLELETRPEALKSNPNLTGNSSATPERSEPVHV
ncbi:hypothetical protein PO909_023370 [Leuciscus waleckii]